VIRAFFDPKNIILLRPTISYWTAIQMSTLIYKLIKFCLVGGSGLAVDFAITYLLKEKVKAHRYFANAMGFSFAATSNYFLNRAWTFESSNPRIYQEYGLFIIFSLIGLGLNTLFLRFFEQRKFNFYVSKFFAIVLTTIWNFGANYFFTFSQS
jgi:putative flippase GtrA